MSREFKIHRKYYEDGRQLYKKASIILEPGITVLIGCNGAGKTTLQTAIYDDLRMKSIPVIRYDNLEKGGSNSLGELMWKADYSTAAQLWCDSEGEAITDNLVRYAAHLKYFIEHGYEKLSDFERLFRDDPGDSESNERWILFDAIDSGLSIDQVQDVKAYFFSALKDLAREHDLYIIVTANEYEMCRGEQCFSVSESKYVPINSYEEYSAAILKSREYKNKMMQKLAEAIKKKEEKKNQ